MSLAGEECETYCEGEGQVNVHTDCWSQQSVTISTLFMWNFCFAMIGSKCVFIPNEPVSKRSLELLNVALNKIQSKCIFQIMVNIAQLLKWLLHSFTEGDDVPSEP